MAGLLEGKVATVTGAARGLGSAIARAFCEAGSAVLLTDISSEGEQAADELRAGGFCAEFMQHDVTDSDAWDAAVLGCQKRWGRLDALVNNAGINLIRTIDEATVDEFHAVLDVNLIGPLRGMKAVSSALSAQGGGAIINIASNSTRKLVPQTTVYSASKAALANLTKASAAHFGRNGSGIRVNSIHPGAHATDMIIGSGTEAPDPSLVSMLVSMIPMGRLGSPSEVGSAAVFLASDMASYITGAELFVDGGAVTG